LYPVNGFLLVSSQANVLSGTSSWLPLGEHKLRKFCAVWYDQTGAVHDCKSDYHAIKKKPENDEFRLYRNGINGDASAITTVVSKFGNTVTTAQLDAHDVQLAKSLQYDITEDGKIISHFHGYLIISDTATDKHQIQSI